MPCNHDELINLQKPSSNLKVTVDVIAVVHRFIIMSRMYKENDKWHWENDEPTYWIPIPKLPKELVYDNKNN